MSFGSSRRLMCSSSLVVVLVIFVLQIWVCSDCNCKAGAIRLLQENGFGKSLRRAARLPRIVIRAKKSTSGSTSMKESTLLMVSTKLRKDLKRAKEECPVAQILSITS
ncbi:hypothetical protein OIU78_004891 [Salix suchowensis]|nr:hypothetical protein OIU78_004891 [Salix suchowensis]